MSAIPDYALETTFDFKFTTRAFATGVPTTLAGTPAVEIYEDNSLTQITTAETLTVDFDSVTGLNNLRIAATAANGFESGKSYAAVISAGTVGGVSVVGEVLLNFSIERTSALRPTTAGRTLDVTATGAAGIDWGNVENPTTAVDLSGTDIQLCDTITTYTGNTVQTGDAFARLGAPAGASVSADIADIPTVSEFNARTLAAASYFDPATDTVANVTTVATTTDVTNGVSLANGAITNASLAGNMEIVFETDFATNYNTTRNAWATNLQDTVGTGNLTADVVAISGDTTAADNAESFFDGTGYAGTGNTIPTVTDVTNGVSLANGAITDASLAGNMEIVFETDFATNYNTTRNAWATNVQDTVGTGNLTADVIAISGSTGAADQLEASAETIVIGTAQTGTLSTTQMSSDLSESTDDHYIGRIIIWTSGALKDQATDITDYTGTNGVLTFTAVTEAPSNGDTFVIV